MADRWARRGVPWPIGAWRLVAAEIEAADYHDNLLVRIPAGQDLGIDDLDRHAFQRGREVGRNNAEVVYTDGAPGLRFFVSYAVSRAREGCRAEMATVVRYEQPRGRRYFAVVKPFHRLLMPWLFARSVRRAVEDRASGS